jgi:hypothetical protein
MREESQTGPNREPWIDVALPGSFADGRMTLSTGFPVASGYADRTTATFALPSDPTYPILIERVVGVSLKHLVYSRPAVRKDQ